MAHGEAILTYEALQALKGRLEPQVLKDHKVILGLLALKGPQAQRVMMELLVLKARQVLLALLVQLALRVLLALQVQQAPHLLMLGQGTV